MWTPRALTRILFTSLWAALAPVQAAADAEPTVPIPRGYVSDYVGVLDAATVRELNALIGELKSKTGAEIAVVVVDSAAPLTAFDYAMKIAEAWKPGAPGKDNGIVFFVAVRDRQLYILTGYGVEGVLPDGKVGEIRDQLVRPAFRERDYARGIRAATQEMAAIIARGAGVQLTGVHPRSAAARTPPSLVSVLILVLFLGIVLILLSRFPASPWFVGGPGRMRRTGGFGGGFGGGFSGGGGGFGGFGGGSFGGGGAGGDW
jgi:uncharacterized protein